WRLASPRAVMAILVVAAIAFTAIDLVPALRPAVLTSRLDPQVGSARVRLLIWRDTVAVIRDAGSRLAFGYGPESLPLVIPSHYSAEIGALEQIDAMPDRAHNETLDMLVSAGVAGTLAQFALVIF